MPKINSLEVVHQDTNADKFDNLHDLLVKFKKFYDESAGKEVVDAEARAAYEVLMEMYVNDKEAFARRIETLSAKFGDSLAQIVEEMLAYASQTEAYAKKITTVSAEVANANAMVQTEMFARATADEAIAQLITTLEAQVDSNTAAITEESTARATADEALASQINTLSATVGSKNRTYYQSSAPSSGMVSGDLWIDSDDDKLYRYNGSSWVNIQDNQIGVNTAAISNEATARATGDSANATTINAVTARLDTGDFAAVKTQSSATASKVSGIEAKWGVTTNVNGQVAGIQLLNGTNTQSSFIVDATKFIVKKPDGSNGIVWNGSKSRLDISGDVYANNFYGNVVNTGNIINNAVTVPAGATGYGPQVTITTSGGPVFIAAASNANGIQAAGNQGQLYRNGGLIFSGSTIYSDLGDAFSSIVYVDYPPAGTHTYQHKWTGGIGTNNPGSIFVLECKR